jgi:YHS domain-containing protein
MRIRMLVSSLMVVALVAVAWAAEPKLDGVKCVVNPKAAAKADKSADYKGGKIYFCCANCPKAYAANPEKFAAAANAQLIATGQAKQIACPLSGKAVGEAKAKVGTIEVGFCCEGCQGKVDAAKDETAKAAIVFSDDAFKKGFKVGE